MLNYPMFLLCPVCPPIPMVHNATYEATGRTIGDTVTYTCHILYEIDDEQRRTVTCENGTWGTLPMCMSKFHITVDL